MAVVAQCLNDHLLDCGRERKETNRRLSRIEAGLLAILAFLAVQAFNELKRPQPAAIAVASAPALPHQP